MVFPYIKMNPPQVYMCSPSWTLLPPPSPYHPSGSSQCTSPKHLVSCIEPGLVTHFIYDIIHVSQIIPSSSSPTESKRLFYTSVFLLLSRIQGYCYHLSKFHIYALVYCIGIFFIYLVVENLFYFKLFSEIIVLYVAFGVSVGGGELRILLIVHLDSDTIKMFS